MAKSRSNSPSLGGTVRSKYMQIGGDGSRQRPSAASSAVAAEDRYMRTPEE